MLEQDVNNAIASREIRDTLASEDELRTQLHLARIREAAESRDAPKIRAVHVAIGVREVRMVEYVIGFETQLNPRAFRDHGVLLNGEVSVPITWATQESAPNVSQRADCVMAEGGGIEPIVVLGPDHRSLRI